MTAVTKKSKGLPLVLEDCRPVQASEPAFSMPENISYRALLDALPVPVFLVAEDVRIVDLNQAAADFCRGTKAELQMRSGGEVFHCLHVNDVPEGCGGGPSCSVCVIRDVVTRCLRGSRIRRRRFRMQVVRDSASADLELLLTASPMRDMGGRDLALLMMEDITEMSTLKDIIPICMNCKKIRDEEKLWQDVAAYFHHYVGVDFTHGVCPACRKKLFPL